MKTLKRLGLLALFAVALGLLAASCTAKKYNSRGLPPSHALDGTGAGGSTGAQPPAAPEKGQHGRLEDQNTAIVAQEPLRFRKEAVVSASPPLSEDAKRRMTLSMSASPEVDEKGDRGEGAIPVTLLPGEELWVIARAAPSAAAAADRDEAIAGLRAVRPGGGDEVPLPLEHTSVTADVAGYIASVRVAQDYGNPYSEKIEAVYVFPLPQDAAVHEFVMTIGDRHIRGIVREREEAEEIYTEARNQGYVASLLTQERPNIFTQRVANIEPGKTIKVELAYVNTLPYHDGEYELAFPTVVGPRFNPPGTMDGIAAVPTGQHGASGQRVEVPYLRPEQRSGHDISIDVSIDAGMTIDRVASPTHRIETTSLSPSRRRVELSRLDSIPNKDFVLRYKVAGEVLKSGLVVHRDERGGFFTLMLQPPADLSRLSRAPVEFIFVLDCSGSMQGVPLDLAKSSAERALKHLGPDDTFQIVRFSDNASQLGDRPVLATRANVERGIEYLRGLNGEGGTMMIEGIRAALDFPHDPRRLRVVSFMTDGYIGNDAEVLGEVQKRLGGARIFSFGVGSSVNRYLLDRMALLGRGAVAYIGLDGGDQDAVEAFYERIQHPALTEVEVDWGGLQVSEVYPRRIPDIFVGRPVVITGRFEGELPASILVRGNAGGEKRELVAPVDRDADEHPGLANIWARLKIADIEDEATVGEAERIRAEIEQVALEYGLLSAYTAFVAVDSSQTTAGDHGTTVFVPVPVPEGVSYDTTVVR